MGSKQVLIKLLAVVAAFGCFWDAASSTPWAHAALKPMAFQRSAVLQPRDFQNQRSAVLHPRKQDSVFQSKQVFETPLTWTFPHNPVLEAKPEVKNFELKQPVPANTVQVKCGENLVQVEVKQDLFGIGQLIQPADLTLGGCAAAGEDVEAQRLIFESELQGCGSTLKMLEDTFIYTFHLLYKPSHIGDTPVVRTTEAVVGIECHYKRKLNVSSNALKPTWTLFADSKLVEAQLYFSLKLMTDDWQIERPSSQYFLGDLIRMEASVLEYHHVPLRIFVESCVATLVPDINSKPRYSFIENDGCLVDAVLMGSSSQFLPRSQDHKLQIQLETFIFKQQYAGPGSNSRTSQKTMDMIYITCHLKATAASSPTYAEGKACSFVNGWRSADGDDQVCGCCDTTCTMRRARAISMDADVQWEADAVLGPISIQ
ncbi:zona pellucida sperm-binding protein 3-like [Salvelinus fontinalis]|uniref:zona pellucida sperm-binding protein 3-like n=1 Tax=Salvelinus fontinalis TaxID=8038 RepID=UPI00248591BD|nr:zona pellucida sperm-binding protein 3-like [Salvelinus fontinalis]